MVFAIYKYQEVIVMLREIEKVLEEDVRPYLLEHEGNVRISEYKEGILKVRLTGQCSGCPSAALTTEELIADSFERRRENGREAGKTSDFFKYTGSQ